MDPDFININVSRKVVQLIDSFSGIGRHQNSRTLMALCNDGTIWQIRSGFAEWEQVTVMPPGCLTPDSDLSK